MEPQLYSSFSPILSPTRGTCLPTKCTCTNAFYIDPYKMYMYKDTLTQRTLSTSMPPIILLLLFDLSTPHLHRDSEQIFKLWICNITPSFIITYENNLPFGKQWQLWHTSPTPHIWSSPSSHSQSMKVKGASPQGSIHHQKVSESWNFTGRAQMCALRQKCF